MMKYATLILVAMLVGFSPAHAADKKGAPQKKVKEVTPSTTRLKLPQAEKDAPPSDPALTLPPSTPCKKKDVLGLWKMEQVYESPRGVETSAFAASPRQYLLFEEGNVYGKYNAAAGMKPPAIKEQIRQHADGLQQYILQDKGYMYFYQNGVANNTQVCFIVSKATTSFAKGQMILMPPKGQVTGRLVKWYSKAIQPAEKKKKKKSKAVAGKPLHAKHVAKAKGKGKAKGKKGKGKGKGKGKNKKKNNKNKNKKANAAATDNNDDDNTN